MLAGFLKAKYGYFFDLFDATGKGFLAKADFESRARHCAAQLGHAQGSSDAHEVHEHFTALWDGAFVAMDPAAGGQVTKDEFTRYAGAHIAGNARAALLARLRELVFRLADPDGDAILNEADYVSCFTSAFGLTAQDARAAFGRLDTEGSGLIGRMHLVFALDDYFRSPEPNSSGNWAFGPGAMAAEK